MKTNRSSAKAISQRNRTPIKTSFMELLGELNSQTKDDTLVLATLRSIFASYKVRFGATLAPVRLVNAPTRTLRGSNLGKHSRAWA